MENSFLIDLDLADLSDQVDSVHRTYTDLGSAVQLLGRDMKVSLGSLVAASVPTSMPSPAVAFSAEAERIKSAIDGAVRSVGDLKGVFENIGPSEEGGSAADTASEAAQQVQESSLAGIDPRKAEQKLDGAESKIYISVTSAEEMVKRHKKRTSRLIEFVEKEMKKTKDKVKSILSNIPGQISSGFLGAVIGSIALGYTEHNRRRAEMGEMANIFEGSVDSVMSAAGRKATRWFANWGERAQWYWGVGRKEVQAAAKVMVDNGFSVTDALRRYDKGLGRVGHNIITLSLGLGKHYNFSTSESMENIVTLVRDYGMSLNSAADLTVKMAAAGERSSIGVSNFTRIVMASADPLSNMGINAETVGSFVEKLLGHYASMGLESQYAGREVEGVAVDLMTAFTKMDNQMKVALARDIFKDTESNAHELLIRFSDGLRRISSGKDESFLESLIRSYGTLVIKRTTPERSKAILAVQQNLRTSNRSAAILVDTLGILEKGATLESMSKEARSNLKQAFTTEGKMVSELFKTRRELVTSMSNIGVGLMAVLVSLIAACILGLKSMMIQGEEGPGGRTAYGLKLKMYYANRQVFKNMADGWDLMLKGTDGVLTVLGKEFGDSLAPAIGAMRWDPKAPPPPPLPGGMKTDPKDSWGGVFGDPEAEQEKRFRREEELLEGTGLQGPAEKHFKLVSATGILGGAVATALSNILVTRNVGADDPKAREHTAQPVVGASSGPVINPAQPPISTEDLGNAVLQSQVEQYPTLNPRMGTP